MSLGPFYTGQIPGNPLVITVRDKQSNEPKSLDSYTGAELRLVNPAGQGIDTEAFGGQATILDSANGLVRYDWPTETLFPVEGDYALQLRLTNENVSDLTVTATFEVYEALPDA